MGENKSLLELTVDELTQKVRETETAFLPQTPTREKLIIYLDLLNRKKLDESANRQEVLTTQNLKIARITLYAAIATIVVSIIQIILSFCHSH